MVIDILFVLILVLSTIKGWQRGVLGAILGLFGWFIAIFISLKVAHYAQPIFQNWLSSHRINYIVTCVILILLSIILFSLISKLSNHFFTLIMLGWASKLAGVLVYFITYIMVASAIIEICIPSQIVQVYAKPSKTYVVFHKVHQLLVWPIYKQSHAVWQNIRNGI